MYTLTPGLLSLGLADNCIGDEGASSLADLLRQTGTLQRLLLSGNEVADEGGSKLVAALTQNNSLKALYLAGVHLSPSPSFLSLSLSLWGYVSEWCRLSAESTGG